ncbi:AurF N-oxygenase family protein [Nocardia cyriacigeorgica]|uniref:AurF N-oxygenase family protein n=1 Tax=Nocardia cyriacigeorgica TaxID=135487 RepID=UPI001893A008|nr:diiron oxygenase [Nocardia cyriacigeorgica]MBF6454601.1 diiron oxygenase [Nocardia cyriacigeorgica]MBF6479680.1 diiron oxygenase [Nocardia cyriacigeorgica]MBF6552495.1 diiron oxygenase [Nocardia cyriacigeorgica]
MTATNPIAGPRNRAGEPADYARLLHELADASVHRHFDPYRDVAWDAPEVQVVPDDPRWILPKFDPLGGHPWYRAQPRERQIAIGMYRQANTARVGLQFEQLLIAGFMVYLGQLPNGSAEFRYATHEVIEECNHTLMFQEAVNRSEIDAPGFGKLFHAVSPLVALFPRISSSFFFMCVLAGEEPIGHIQKQYLREQDGYHPMVRAVMRIHVAEEARHISFAHEFLRRHVPRASAPARLALSLVFPVALRVACDLIAVPPRDFWREFDIPDHVRREVFWGSPRSRATLRGYFGDVRMLAEEIGMMNPVSRRLWQALGIDGRVSRHRSEPDRAPGPR